MALSALVCATLCGVAVRSIPRSRVLMAIALPIPLGFAAFHIAAAYMWLLHCRPHTTACGPHPGAVVLTFSAYVSVAALIGAAMGSVLGLVLAGRTKP